MNPIDSSECTVSQIVVPHRITRTYIQRNRHLRFIYSFDVAGKSALGQAAFAHNEPNTSPVNVMYKFCANPVYFQDNDECKSHIYDSINHIPLDLPIIPFPKIGLGHSRLKEFAPECYDLVHRLLSEIKWPNIKIDYTV